MATRQIYRRTVQDGGSVHDEVIDQRAAVTDVGAVVAVTYTANAPAAANGALTIADGTVPTVAELGEFCHELLSDVTDLRTQVNALLARCREAGIIAT